MRLSPCISSKGVKFPLDWKQAPIATPLSFPLKAKDWGKASNREGNGLKNCAKPNRVLPYTFNLFQGKNTPVAKPEMSLCQCVCKYVAGLLRLALPLALHLIDPLKKKKGLHGSPGQASFPHLSCSTWPCTHLPNEGWRALQLQLGWLSEIVRPGDSSGSLPLFSMPHPI